MSTPALSLPLPAHDFVCAQRRNWATKLWRGLVCCALSSIIFLPEFPRQASADAALYARAIGGFRYIDLIIIAVAVCHLIGGGCLRRTVVFFPRSLALPGLAFLACIAIAIAYGWGQGGSDFFFDWRALALGAGLYLVWCSWLQNDLAFAIRIFALYVTGRMLWLYLAYVMGRGDTLLGVAIPIFDGPIISTFVFVGVLGLALQDSASTRRQRVLWFSVAGFACLMVVLCMRRTYWAELAIATLLLMTIRKRNRIRRLSVVVAPVLIGAGMLGASFADRLGSFDVSNTEAAFSTDNTDHVNDLLDAWQQVKQSPVMGSGVGVPYPTWHTRHWKTESMMVHNAPLHVWIKYGLAGLVCYLWFHLALLRWLFRGSRDAAGASSALPAAAFAYLAAQFVVTFAFAPWPYSELQLTTLTSFILATAVISAHSQSALHAL